MSSTPEQSSKLRAGVFLDRDGTVTVERGYITSPDDLELYPQSAVAIRKLNDEGVPVVIVTNQSGVARGLLSEDTLGEIHVIMIRLLGDDDAHLDGIYYCPHHPDHGPPQYRKDCGCRKPETGMLEQASRDLGIDLSSSYVAGDKMTDVKFAKNAGCRSVLVTTGYGESELTTVHFGGNMVPEFVASDILDAVDWILEEISKNSSSGNRNK